MSLLTSQTFPNVTNPHFEIAGGFVDELGGTVMVASAPLISASEREAWKEYSVVHQDWLKESAFLKDEYTQHLHPLHGTILDHDHVEGEDNDHEGDEHDRRLEVPKEINYNQNHSILDEIWEWHGHNKVVASNEEDSRIFAPVWQTTPADPVTVNFDLLSNPDIFQLFKDMVMMQEAVMSPGIQIGNLFDWVVHEDWKHLKEEAHALIMEPLFSNFSRAQNPVGFLLALAPYRNFFLHLLPEGTRGIYCVVQDTCGNILTLELNGAGAIFLGYDDFHKGYDEYHEQSRLELYENDALEICVKDLHIYPSLDFESTYQTNKPA